MSSVGSGRVEEPRSSPGAEPPSGRQHRLVHVDQEAVITEVGATLRAYIVDGRPAIDGFGPGERATDGRGQVLMPWPGRVGDGRYGWDGVEHQLPIGETDLGNALHGLVRWDNWVAEWGSDDRLVMRDRLHPRDGYPFCLDLAVSFELEDRGLRASLSATNLGDSPAPFGAGAHPYLTLGTPLIDCCLLRLPASTVLETDHRMLPVGRAAVDGTAFDFRVPRPIGPIRLNTAFTDLERDADGVARVALESPDGRRLVLWADRGFGWVVVFSGDSLPPAERRRGLAIEPMTCPPDAFRSGEDLIALGPGESITAGWGIDVTSFRA